MNERISIAELREAATREAYGNPYGEHAPTVLALVEAVEAAHAWRASVDLGQPGTPVRLLLDHALDRFDFGGSA